jgi:hypothetical protein
MSLGAKTSRYVKLVFMNSGEFDDPSWVEVGLPSSSTRRLL